MLSPLPRRSSWVPISLSSPALSTFPERVVGSACATSFSRIAQRSLTLRPAHSRCHHISRHASPEASTTSLPPRLLRLLPAGAIMAGWVLPTGKRRLSTAHTRSGRRSSGPIYTPSGILNFLVTPTKPNPPKGGDGKPRVLASSATPPATPRRTPRPPSCRRQNV
jgi:hypothetical protein